MTAGDVGHEAYTAIMWGGIMSRVSSVVTEAEAVPSAEGNIGGAAMQGVDTPSWSKTPSRTKGTGRNLGDLMSDLTALGLSGPRRESQRSSRKTASSSDLRRVSRFCCKFDAAGPVG